MKKNFLRPSLLLLISLMFVANQAQAQQTCNPNVVETAPASRFTINGDGTVTDIQTRLTWAQCPQGLSGPNCTSGTATIVSWEQALAFNGIRPTSVTTGPTDGTDWRLPNIKELFSIVERACAGPAINLMIFPNTIDPDPDPMDPAGDRFWSASPSVTSGSGSTQALTVSFISGNSGFEIRSINANLPIQLRLVRGDSVRQIR